MGAAWEVMQDSQIELCAINPCFTLGPTLYSDSSLVRGFESGESMMKFCSGEFPLVPHLMVSFCDVRDVAEAHLRALTNIDAPGRRFIVGYQTRWFKEMQAMIATKVGQRPAGELPSCLVGWLALCSPVFRILKQGVDKSWKLDATETNRTL